MKQTAVEWLEEMMNINGNISVYFQEILDQAKAMEKERNIEFAKFFYELITQKEIAKHVVEVIHFETFKSE